MGFGLNVKVETPKVEVPKVDVAAAAKSAASAVTGAASGAVDSAKSAVNSAVDSAKGAVNDAVGAVTGAVNNAVDAATDAVESVKASLSTVAGAIADVAISFTGAIEDFVLEPHLQLDANASFGKTKFEKGPIWIRIEIPADKANDTREMLHFFTTTGSYNQKKQMRDYIESTPNTIDVLFEDAPMNENYSLEIMLNGKCRTIFKNIPYGDLRKMRSQY
ncbi:MAG: hypothetical protein ACM31E_01810 [Fibrobacterota bacterium]|nr:hypothetical protein [Chitinispirillaceae bacterium]